MILMLIEWMHGVITLLKNNVSIVLVVVLALSWFSFLFVAFHAGRRIRYHEERSEFIVSLLHMIRRDLADNKDFDGTSALISEVIRYLEPSKPDESMITELRTQAEWNTVILQDIYWLSQWKDSPERGHIMCLLDMIAVLPPGTLERLYNVKANSKVL